MFAAKSNIFIHTNKKIFITVVHHMMMVVRRRPIKNFYSSKLKIELRRGCETKVDSCFLCSNNDVMDFF